MKKSLIDNKVIIAVDFDGTITTNPETGPVEDLVLREGAVEVIKELHDTGALLILWTCRTGKTLDEAEAFLSGHDILDCFIAINDHIPEVLEKYHPEVARKVGADFYLDDKSLLNGEFSWAKVRKAIFGEDD